MRAALERLCCRVEHKWGPAEEKYGMIQFECQRRSCIAVKRVTRVHYELCRSVARNTEAQLLAIDRIRLNFNASRGPCGMIKWRRYSRTGKY